MIDLEQFEKLNPAEVSDEQMMKFQEELLKMHDELVDAWAEEVKTVCTDDFDPYSFWGSRKLDKIGKKHSKTLANVDLLLEIIDGEMTRRDQYNEEQRYTGSGKYKPRYSLDEEEYIENEKKKNERIRNVYDFDDDDDE